MLRWLITMLGAGLALLVGFAPYPSYVVTLDRAPSDVRVGVPFEVGFSIRAAEGNQPPSALTPLVVATNAATREQIKVSARPSAPGHYAALLILPAAGRWQWEIYPEGQAGVTPVAMSPLVVGDEGADWLQASLTLALLALLGAVVGVLAAGRVVKRRVVVESM